MIPPTSSRSPRAGSGRTQCPAGADAPVLAPARPGALRRLLNLRALVDLPGELARLHAGEAPAVRLDVGPYPLAYVRRPETVKALLDGALAGVAERGRFFEDVGRVIGRHSLVTCQGDEHRQLRRLLSVAFRPDAVTEYASTMATVTAEMMADFSDGKQVALDELMSRLTLEIAARALLGLARAEQLDDFAAVLATGSRLFYRLMLPRRLGDALWRSPFSPANRRLRHAQARVDRLVEALLGERRQLMAGVQGAADGPTPSGRPANLLDVLLAAEGAGALETEVVRDQIVTFLFAGHETTAQALTWTFVLLERNPSVRARLERELDALGGPPAPGDLPALRATRAVVREALRLYPPAWFLTREASTATVIDGCPVPAGTLLLASPLALQRDATHFPAPERFDPDRWLADDPEGAPPGAYLPFGHGRRNCIGSNFAMTELVIVVASLAREWRLRVLDADAVRERPTVTLRPRRQVAVVLERRDAQSG